MRTLRTRRHRTTSGATHELLEMLLRLMHNLEDQATPVAVVRPAEKTAAREPRR